MTVARVVALVVTYNRSALIRRCLAAISRQTRPPDHIVVIDNGSIDDTAAVVRSEFPSVEFCTMSRNVADAGGFAAGMHLALARGFDLVWLSDDDGYPDADCLDHLLRVQREHALDWVNAVVLDEESPAHLAFHLKRNGRLVSTLSEAHEIAGGALLEGDANPWNGTLLTADLIRRIGTVRPEMFGHGCELEFTLRAKRMGMRIATDLAAFNYHPRSHPTLIRLMFGLPAQLVIMSEKRLPIQARNFGYIERRYRSAVHGALCLLLYVSYYMLSGKVKSAGIFLRYFIDGATDRYRLAPSRADICEATLAVPADGGGKTASLPHNPMVV
jgi:rhamnopyranosyl-N-acetylglucosaminyl-diphospho-decaprenol beta-1,3/1,4-galactofuranosyltransferase